MRENLSPEPQQLAELVEFQLGSVVSRTLLQKSAGTVTLFAFDQDESLSEHTTPYDALVQVVEGKMKIKIAERDHNLKTGDILVLPANVPHSVFALKSSKMMLIMIRE